MSKNIRPRPDLAEFLAVVRRERLPRRVHNVELFLDEEVRSVLARQLDLGGAADPADPLSACRRDAALFEALGYDVFRATVIRKEIFPTASHLSRDTTNEPGQTRGERSWQDELTGPIGGWKDFETYPWPTVSELDFGILEWMEKNIPEGMGCYDLTAHVFEMLSFLTGYQTLCFLIADEPALVDAICEKVGRFYVDYTKALCGFSSVAVIWGSDDFGFRSSTMVSPAFLREKILPWHAECARLAHEAGKPYFLHSCGNLDEIMEDLLSTVRIDARHSFEDAILPVTEAKQRYGRRVSLLGGIDMDFLCRATEAQVRERVRATLDSCMPGGGYCLGTGNTMANYVPLANYLAMLDEGWRYRT
jgi:uroporphyrinogen decarboxylase